MYGQEGERAFRWIHAIFGNVRSRTKDRKTTAAARNNVSESHVSERLRGMEMNLMELAQEIVNGRRLTKEDDLSFLITTDLDELCDGADHIREKLCGEKVDLCTIINGRSGKCGEDCKYCAQSVHYDTDCQVYDFLDEEAIFQEALHNQTEGVDRFSIVTSGKALSGEEFEKCLRIYRRMHEELHIHLCASLGFLTPEQFHRLHEAGVTAYHDNIETSERYFPEICTTHSFAGKLATIKAAKAEGLEVCSGGIIGMGETWTDRIDMALTLSELGISSIPINVLMPIKGTPLQDRPVLSDAEALRTIAIFRYINPASDIRLAGGRMTMSNNGEKAFTSGASATITGDMLTTSGSTIASDRAMLTGMGREVIAK